MENIRRHHGCFAAKKRFSGVIHIDDEKAFLGAKRGWGAAAAEAVAENAQSASSPLKLFHRVVLPEFAAWLYSSEGRVLK